MMHLSHQFDPSPVADFQFGTPDPDRGFYQEQQLQALSEEVASLNEKVDGVQRETEAMQVQAKSLEKKARSLKSVTNVAIAMGGLLALYILDYGIKQAKQQYFA
jgi:hypothetical protein